MCKKFLPGAGGGQHGRLLARGIAAQFCAVQHKKKTQTDGRGDRAAVHRPWTLDTDGAGALEQRSNPVLVVGLHVRGEEQEAALRRRDAVEVVHVHPNVLGVLDHLVRLEELVDVVQEDGVEVDGEDLGDVDRAQPLMIGL